MDFSGGGGRREEVLELSKEGHLWGGAEGRSTTGKGKSAFEAHLTLCFAPNKNLMRLPLNNVNFFKRQPLLTIPDFTQEELS